MRKFLFLGISICFLISCASGSRQIDDFTSKTYIGMSISDFMKLEGRKKMVSMQNGVSIYKVVKRVWYDSDGSGSDHMFFYFVDQKLTQVDKGERAVDYRIRVD
ncbi:hypothetical protein [Flavobacterium sp. GNP002]